MNESDLVASYLKTQQAPRTSGSWRSVLFLWTPSVLGCAALAIGLQRMSGAPWWIGLVGLFLGGVIGSVVTWKLDWGLNFLSENRWRRRIGFFVGYVIFKGSSDLLAWWLIPGQPYHLAFDFSVFFSAACGGLIVAWIWWQMKFAR